MNRLLAVSLLLSLFVFACRLPSGIRTEAEPSAPAPLSSGNIMVVYPKPSATIEAPSTFLIGSVPPGSALTCNGAPVRLNQQGYFAHVVSLKPGPNDFKLSSSSAGSVSSLSLVIKREAAVLQLPANPLTIAAASAQPSQDLGLTAGDILQLSVKASPGGQVTAQLGNRRIALQSSVLPGKKPAGHVNQGLSAAYGVVYQRTPGHSPDLYTGFYKIAAEDRWSKVRPRFVLTRSGRTVSALSPASLTVIQQPKIAQTIHDLTVVRLGPGQARTTPLPSGVRLMVDGWQADALRCYLSVSRHVWILKEDLAFEDKSGFAPTSTIRTINLSAEPTGIAVNLPLNQRLPFEIEQRVHPNRLVLRVYGATSDTDWITPASVPAEGALIDNIAWKQESDRVYEVEIRLRDKRQWGFWAEYRGTELALHIKAAPKTVPGGGPLNGVSICVDPGHGGSETGAIGPSGIKESSVNLSIASKLKDLLKADGARVIMTRQTDDIDVSLADRVKTAVDSRADLLISVHNNALPDGRDPWAEHGSSSYWYHQQSTELAQKIKSTLVSGLGFPDYGTFYSNLALVRPTNMPAVLAEIGFMINPDEYASLIQPATQEKAARALRDGILEYMSSLGPAADKRTVDGGR